MRAEPRWAAPERRSMRAPRSEVVAALGPNTPRPEPPRSPHPLRLPYASRRQDTRIVRPRSPDFSASRRSERRRSPAELRRPPCSFRARARRASAKPRRAAACRRSRTGLARRSSAPDRSRRSRPSSDRPAARAERVGARDGDPPERRPAVRGRGIGADHAQRGDRHVVAAAARDHGHRRRAVRNRDRRGASGRTGPTVLAS